MRYGKQNTAIERQERERIENAFATITPLSEIGRKLLSIEGFVELFYEMRYLYPTYVEAYERLEEVCESIIGHRRYSEYRSFIVATKHLRCRR